MNTIMVDIEELLPEVLRHAPNLPEPTAEHYIRVVARELCDTTQVWRELNTYDIMDPTYECLVDVSDASVVYVEQAFLDGCELIPITVPQLDEKFPNWAFDTQEANAKYLTQLTPDSFQVYPRQKGTLQCRLVLKPSHDAETLPKFLVDQYYELIGLGAAGEALAMPDREFSNPGAASNYLAKYQTKLNRAFTTVPQGQQRAKHRVKGYMF